MTRDEVLALEAGEVMDALVAQLVMGWHRGSDCKHPRPEGEDWQAWSDADHKSTGWYIDGDGDYYACGERCTDWRPSTEIGAAWEVVEKLKGIDSFYAVEVVALANRFAANVLRFTDGPPAVYRPCRAAAPTAALAICRAALASLLAAE